MSGNPNIRVPRVVRTLLVRCEGVVMEEEDKGIEKENIKKALVGFGYPRWSMDLV